MKNSDPHLGPDELEADDRQQKLERVRSLIRQYIPEGRSLSEELIQERREEAKREL